MATATDKSAKQCAMCKEQPSIEGQAYCKTCRAAYQKQYRDQELTVAVRRGQIQGFKLGTEAMRKAIVGDFSANAAPGGMMRAGEIVKYILTMPQPAFEPLAETPTESESVRSASPQ